MGDLCVCVCVWAAHAPKRWHPHRYHPLSLATLARQFRACCKQKVAGPCASYTCAARDHSE
eukprot:3185905-Alexandrium_andersonii.AAC.1